MKRRAVYLAIAFVLCFLSTGSAYWSIPYSSINLPDALYGPGLVLVALSAFTLCLLRIAGFWRCVIAPFASVPTAVFARIVVEGILDPSSHNLWPFEIFIAAALSLVCALCAALLGYALSKLGVLSALGKLEK